MFCTPSDQVKDKASTNQNTTNCSVGEEHTTLLALQMNYMQQVTTGVYRHTKCNTFNHGTQKQILAVIAHKNKHL